jgi:hypothetical protein
MTLHIALPEDPSIKREKIKRDLIKILKRNGFKRSFLKHPASEVYVKGDLKAKVYLRTDILGSEELGIPPVNVDQEVAGVKIDGPTKDSKIEKEIYAYRGNYLEKYIEKRKQKASGIEKKFGVFIAFIIGGVALSLGSLTITGNAISNLTGTTPGLLGIILFIAGFVGMFFYFRRK